MVKIMQVKRLRNDELYHHGVKGQSWGVKNGPPYPLNATGKALVKQQKLMKNKKKLLLELWQLLSMHIAIIRVVV